MVPLGASTAGETLCVIERSAAATLTLAVAVLFERLASLPDSLTVTVSLIVVPTTPAPGLTFTTTVSVAVPPLAATVMPELAVHVIVPVVPAPGTVHEKL